MNRLTSSLIAIAATAVWVALAQEYYPILGTAKPEEISVARKYDGADGAIVEGIGVCQIENSKADCWDMDGKRDDALNHEVDKGLALFPEIIRAGLVPNPQRCFAVRTNQAGFRANWIKSGEGSGFGFPVGNGWRIDLIPATADPPATTLTLKINDPAQTASKTMPLRTGAKVTVAGCEIEVGSISEVRSRTVDLRAPARGSAKSWRVVIGAKSDRPSGSLDIELLDRYGTLITLVDSAGRPVPNTTLSKLIEDAKAGKPRSGLLDGLSLTRLQPTGEALPEAFAATMGVDPKWVKSIKVSIFAKRRISITGFPAHVNVAPAEFRAP